MKNIRNSFAVGENVFAETKNSYHWPGKVTQIESGCKTSYIIKFYNKKGSESCDEAWLKKWSPETEELYFKRFNTFVVALNMMKEDQDASPLKVPEAKIQVKQVHKKDQKASNIETKKRGLFSDITNKAINVPSKLKPYQEQKLALAEKKYNNIQKENEKQVLSLKVDPKPKVTALKVDNSEHKLALAEKKSKNIQKENKKEASSLKIVQVPKVSSLKVNNSEQKLALVEKKSKDNQKENKIPSSKVKNFNVVLKKQSALVEISNKVIKQEPVEKPAEKKTEPSTKPKVNIRSEFLEKMKGYEDLILKLSYRAKVDSEKFKRIDLKVNELVSMLKAMVSPGMLKERPRRTINPKPVADSEDILKIKTDLEKLDSNEIFLVKESLIQGTGAFAKRLIKKGELFAEYEGEVIDQYEADYRAIIYKNEDKADYLFSLRSGGVVDGNVAGNNSKFINHSCEPNAAVLPFIIDGKERLLFYTNRNIEVAEEITIDYKFRDEKIYCNCRSKNCRLYLN